MFTYHNEEVLSFNFDESAVLGLEWVNEYKDLHVKLDWADERDLAPDCCPTLAFDFVTELEAQFAFPKMTMGSMQIGTIEFVPLENRTWSVAIQFYFQPVGHIRFNCTNIKFTHN